MVTASTWCDLLLLVATACGVSLSSSQARELVTDKLTWQNISQPYIRGALCNDFTPAGYFIRKVNDEEKGRWFSESYSSDPSRGNKWVLFLEGGGSCTSPSSCNRRYGSQRYKRVYRNFEEVEDEPAASNKESRVTNKLMTSLWRYSNYNSDPKTDTLNSSSNLWTIEGRDLLSTSMADNPDFYDYNHILIPYCSSDLWLKKTNNFRKAQQENFEFQFDPDASEQHQFTFRGAAIFRSVVEDLYTYHDFSRASEVLLAGSGAGGLGALNHAYWLNEVLLKNAGVEGARLYVLLDSSWFVDFGGATSGEYSPDNLERLVANRELVETCMPNFPEEIAEGEERDIEDGYFDGDMVENQTTNGSIFSVPCLSVQGVLRAGRFPAGVPVLAIISQYDVYYLAKAIASVLSIDDVSFNE